MKPTLDDHSFEELILGEGLDSFDGLNHLPFVKNSIRVILEENVLGGKMTRGKLLIEAGFDCGCSCIDCNNDCNNDYNSDISRNLCKLAWLVEILQTSFLIADDIMDEGEERRAKVCWYKKVGLGALNDSFILQSFINSMLRCTSSFGYRMMELFDRVKMHTEVGQLLDMRWYFCIDFGGGGGRDGNVVGNNSSECMIAKPITRELLATLKNVYYEICYKKTAYYTIYLPIVAGLIFRGGKDVANEIEEWTPVMLEVGRFFQMQDDYLDVFGDPYVMGKANRQDVLEGKCTWPLVTAAEYLMEIGDSTSLATIERYLSHLVEGGKVGEEMNDSILKIYDEIVPLEEEFRREEQSILKLVDEHSARGRSAHFCSSLIGGIVERLTGRKK